MLTRIRPSFALGLLLFLVGGLSVVEAQIHGVPASVTSIGFGGNMSSAPGIPASVTSLGPNGFGTGIGFFGNCCNGPIFGGFRHGSILTGRHFREHRGYFPMAMPVYSVPYTPVMLVQPEMTGEGDEEEYYGGPTIFDRRGPGNQRLKAYVEPEPQRAPAETAAAPAPEPAPVVAQPSTVLVYKDGHQVEVVNYAIVSGVLHEFLDGRARKIPLTDLDLPATRKANDERGVDFQVPAAR